MIPFTLKNILKFEIDLLSLNFICKNELTMIKLYLFYNSLNYLINNSKIFFLILLLTSKTLYLNKKFKNRFLSENKESTSKKKEKLIQTDNINELNKKVYIESSDSFDNCSDSDSDIGKNLQNSKISKEININDSYIDDKKFN